MNKILIGTTNPGKLGDWKNRLRDFNLVSLKDLGIVFDVSEDMVSLENNSKKKASAYAKESGLVTISDDIGFFINELDGKPGVSVKRWGGELSRELTGEEFLEFFASKVSCLNDTSSYILKIISIAGPDGLVRTVEHRADGYIDRSRFSCNAIKGFPLSKVFVRHDTGKTWAEMSEFERNEFDFSTTKKVKECLEDLLYEF